MSKQPLVVEMNLTFVAKDITPIELIVHFNNFLKEHTELVSQSERTTPVEIVESSIKSIVGFDEEDNEIEFLDNRGSLQNLSEEVIEDAIDKGLIGE